MFTDMLGELLANTNYYPSCLYDLRDPPKVLYYRGDLGALNHSCISIVGTRNMTSYGESVLNAFFHYFRGHSLTIVSGFMYGVDYYAHIKALEYGLKTVAVLPCGIDYIYPRCHEPLYHEILSHGGLILSEYPGTSPPEKWTFVKRNRLVAGLSSSILVVEASENSGSLITADIANSLSRKVFSVPGNIFSSESLGTNQILCTYAHPALSGGSLLDEFG